MKEIAWKMFCEEERAYGKVLRQEVSCYVKQREGQLSWIMVSKMRLKRQIWGQSCRPS